ncbi:MAG TPA: heme exporter protein CcmD [Methylophilaceae bacterium]|nr:heme exporter protein CcmD [Methylophilaceae bacterium]
MYWNSISEFLHMGGYSLYVWVSFGVTFGCMAIELFLLRARKLSHEKIKDLL